MGKYTGVGARRRDKSEKTSVVTAEVTLGEVMDGIVDVVVDELADGGASRVGVVVCAWPKVAATIEASEELSRNSVATPQPEARTLAPTKVSSQTIGVTNRRE